VGVMRAAHARARAERGSRPAKIFAFLCKVISRTVALAGLFVRHRESQRLLVWRVFVKSSLAMKV